MFRYYSLHNPDGQQLNARGCKQTREMKTGTSVDLENFRSYSKEYYNFKNLKIFLLIYYSMLVR